VDVRAVTAWSALGAFDWDSLLTREAGHYEPGLFDVRGEASRGAPRPTALAHVLRDLATRGASDHPALAGPGWWEMPERLHYPTVRRHRASATDRAIDRALGGDADASLGLPAAVRPETGTPRPAHAPPVLVVGARGTLARAVVAKCRERGLAHVALGRPELDAADAASVEAALAAHRPWAVVNTAGFVRVDDAERERDACWRENVCAAAVLARACAAHGARLATFSTDLVFDGAAHGRPYEEGDAVRPLNVYGASKAEAEAAVLAAHPAALVVRTAAFFGPVDEWNFLTLVLRELAAGREFHALDDVHVSPTYVPALADATLDLLVDGERGVWHLANDVTGHDAPTWYDFARRGAARAGLDADGVRPLALEHAGLAAARPRWSVLGSARGRLLGPLDTAISHYLHARAWSMPTGDARAPSARPRGRATPVAGARPSVRQRTPHAASLGSL
jgi:dTDP-4-dehydrorhamnose reductase